MEDGRKVSATIPEAPEYWQSVHLLIPICSIHTSAQMSQHFSRFVAQSHCLPESYVWHEILASLSLNAWHSGVYRF